MPEMKPEHRKEALQTPVFGERPPPGPTLGQNGRVFRYASLLHKVREYPGQWAKIAVFEDGSPKKTATRLTGVRTQISSYLLRSFPLEVWDQSSRRDVTHWSRRELWVRYNGVITPEEAAQLREARREVFQRGQINGEKKRAARETAQRIKSLAVNQEIRELQAHQRGMNSRG